MKTSFPLLIIVLVLFAFKGNENYAEYTISKEKNNLILNITFDSKQVHDALTKSNKCDDQSKFTVCVDSYLKENVEILVDSARAKFSFMSSSTVNHNLKMKYRLTRVPYDFENIIIKNTFMINEQAKFKNKVIVNIGKKAKEFEMTKKKTVIELEM